MYDSFYPLYKDFEKLSPDLVLNFYYETMEYELYVDVDSQNTE
jgi:hypothetical protein